MKQISITKVEKGKIITKKVDEGLVSLYITQGWKLAPKKNDKMIINKQ